MSLLKPMRSKGFSLVEVVVAVGIFAITIVGVLGLLAPTSKNISDVSDSDAASRVIAAIQSGLQTAGYSSVNASLIADKQFYATKDGSKVAASDAVGVWISGQNQEKFFEFKLVRDTTLSPVANDGTAGFLAFTIVLKWPSYVPTPDGVTGTAVNDAQKSVVVVPAAITR